MNRGAFRSPAPSGFKQRLLLGSSIHAGFDGEKSNQRLPPRGEPFLPLKSSQAAALGWCCSSVGCQGALGTVAGSQESCRSHSGTAAPPRARPRGRHRHPPGSCCPIFQELGLSTPSHTFAGLLWSFGICLQSRHSDPVLAAAGSKDGASRCPSWRF